MIDVRLCTIDEVFDSESFKSLTASYANEAGDSAAIPVNGIAINKDFYKKAVETGTLVPFAAFDDGRLVGFMSLLMYHHQHTGANLANVETIYVDPSYRSNVGPRLIVNAVNFARLHAVQSLVMTAKHGTDFHKHLKASKRFKETYSTFLMEI